MDGWMELDRIGLMDRIEWMDGIACFALEEEIKPKYSILNLLIKLIKLKLLALPVP